jgi:hypothetical protein
MCENPIFSCMVFGSKGNLRGDETFKKKVSTYALKHFAF